MLDFNSVFTAAQQLPEQDRLRLIEKLWDSVDSAAETPFTDEWTNEIERRVAEFENGAVKTVPWLQIRDEALARVGYGTKD